MNLGPTPLMLAILVGAMALFACEHSTKGVWSYYEANSLEPSKIGK